MDVLALAVDLGATKVEAALVDVSGQLLAGSRFREPTWPSRTSAQLAANVDSVVTRALAAAPAGGTIIGVGIGAAGPIVEAEGLVSPLNLPAWRDYPLLDQVTAAAPGLPVTLRMDGLCITLAEHWVGAARGYDNVMGMVVSTGIGGGLILGGRTASGPTGNAGHIGHVEVAGFSDRCACGGIGCVEAIASGPNSVAWARSQGWTTEPPGRTWPPTTSPDTRWRGQRSSGPAAPSAKRSHPQPRSSTSSWWRSAAGSRGPLPTSSITSAPPSPRGASSVSSPR